MRLTRTLGLFLIASLATMALIGVGSASASSNIVLCKTNVEYCHNESAAGYAFTATSTAKFNFGEEKGKVQCSSTMTRAEDEWIGTLSFSACTEGCTVTASKLPYYGGYVYEPVAGSAKISLLISGFVFKCGASECVYSGYANELGFEGGTPAVIHINKQLKEEAGSLLCPKTVQWEADYKLKSPATTIYITNRAVEGPAFCGVNENPCPQASVKTFNEFPSKGNITVGLFPGSTQITCTSGGFALNNFEPYKIGGQWNYKPWNPSGCTSPVYTGCSLSLDNPPYIGTLEPSGKGSGTVLVAETVSHVPTLSVKCSSGGTPFTCVYTAKSFTLKFTGGAPATMSTSTALSRQSGSAVYCSASVTMAAEYQSYEGKALYMQSS